MSTIVVDKLEVKDLIEKQILDLVNEAYFLAQERYTKLPKKAQLILDDYVDPDEESDDCILGSIREYRKEPFNVVFPELKTKDMKSIVARAVLILDYVKFLDLQINTRGYNLLRYLSIHYDEN